MFSESVVTDAIRLEGDFLDNWKNKNLLGIYEVLVSEYIVFKYDSLFMIHMNIEIFR